MTPRQALLALDEQRQAMVPAWNKVMAAMALLLAACSSERSAETSRSSDSAPPIDQAERPTVIADRPRMMAMAAPVPGVKVDTTRILDTVRTADTTRWQDTTRLGDTVIVFRRGRLATATTAQSNQTIIRRASSTLLVDSTWIVRVGFFTTGGIPFGLFAMWDGSTPKPNTQSFSMFYGNTTPSTVVGQIAAARQQRVRLVTTLTGGARANYLSRLPDLSTRDTTDSLLQFDMAKWRARLNLYNTPTLKPAINSAIADGTLIAGTVIDEPFNCGGPGNELNGWGCTLNSEGKRVVPVLTKARVDSMCVYQRQVFPNLAAGPFHDPDDFDTSHEYARCDFVVAQYRYAKGSLTTFRDQVLAFSRKNGTAPATAINVYDGGPKIAGCPKPQTGGPGSYGANCRMNPAQVREAGITLGRIGCFLTGFRLIPDMAADTAYRAAFKAVSDSLSRLPAKPCRRAA